MIDQGDSEEDLEALQKLLAIDVDSVSDEEMDRRMAEIEKSPLGKMLLEEAEYIVENAENFSEGQASVKYERPMSPARVLLKLERLVPERSGWIQISLPVDASFFDVHCAIEDCFRHRDSQGHRFVFRERGEEVLGVSLGHRETDVDEVLNRPMEAIEELGGEFFYGSVGQESWEFRVVVQELSPDVHREVLFQIHDGDSDLIWGISFRDPQEVYEELMES